MDLSVENLTFQYPHQKKSALQSVSFQINAGSSWCIAGPNGSGKSTLLKIISGLLKTTQGNVQWKSVEHSYSKISEWPSDVLASQVGFISATIQTDFPVTVFEFILQGLFPLHKKTLFSGVQSYSKEETVLVEKKMTEMEIAPLRDKLLSEVSTGELQLALIARTLVRKPRVLVFDESITNLDFAHLSKIYELLSALKKTGITLIMVSHDLNLVTEFCENLLWLKEGQCLGFGPTIEMFTKEWIDKVYAGGNAQLKIKVDKNPFTGKAKVFWV